ncbi:hypothetical protein SAMN04515647_0175 [Cohaesibacter sp. ES.047]|uniref:hypothetical protein n=1 Tax=Cohaesibacter sp. ES.047 TaxID=1798205 RepID=UPI000BB7EAD1|nr:hypothetical protein [Cohaesibacter sp. ES.047]SNY90034.1 hypothetical protein SAMN04515647_0175 [Cohaesibacter sp. ES.047]
MNLIDTSHPMLRPLWVRLLTTLAPSAWALFELSLGNVTWAVMFGVVGCLCLFSLILTYKDPGEPEE